MQIITPDWYFILSDGTIWSAPKAATVTATDPDYTAWLALGREAMPVVDMARLAEILRADGVKPYRSVTPRQIRIALNIQALRDSVETWVAAQDKNTQDSWATATAIVEDNQLIAACMTAIGKTDADRTAVFDLAATIK